MLDSERMTGVEYDNEIIMCWIAHLKYFSLYWRPYLSPYFMTVASKLLSLGDERHYV